MTVEVVVHEAGDDGGFSDRLIPEEYELVFGEGCEGGGGCGGGSFGSARALDGCGGGGGFGFGC